MSNDLKKYFCPRLIDFIIICGCKEPLSPSQLLAKHVLQQQQQQKHYEDSLPPEFQSSKYNYKSKVSQSPLAQMPELLRRYPLDDHNDFMLPQDVPYFCQPEGCVNINCSSQQKANSSKETTSFIFSLTEKDSARVRYGVCFNFFRPIEKKFDQHRRNSLQKRLLKQKQQNSNHKNSDQKETDDDEDDDENDEQDNQHDHDNKQSSNIKEKHFTKTSSKSSIAKSNKQSRNRKASHVKYTHTLTTLCIISHHPFFSIFRECLNILRRIIEACHARSLASKPSTPISAGAASSSNKNAYDTVWGILTGSSGTISTDQISSLVAREIKEIETWILRLLSAPVPVPGKTKLIVIMIIICFIF
jgi:hypothetical protein